MKPYVIYNAAGRILRTGVCQDHMVAQQALLGESAIEGAANDVTQYVDIATQAVAYKSPLGGTPDKTTVLANRVDVVTISGLPNPTTARIAGPGTNQTTIVTDGSLELTFAAAGEYRVRLSALHRLDQEVVITANAG